jgi:tRNA(Ile)-lysidine synthetase-like protein
MNDRTSPARTERSLRQRLLRAYREDLPFVPARIIVGFSGGTDSLALALLLTRLQSAIPSRIELLHIDHAIRADSADDAEACRQLAGTMHLPMRSVRLTAHPVTLYPGTGLEEAARRARYRVFAGVAERGDVVALAHQAGDQAETMLLHLMHGAGLTGLAGMRPVSRLQVPWWANSEEPRPLVVWRPLLLEHRADLEQVVKHHGLEPVHDPSNLDLHLKRNAIRQIALPALRRVEPTIVDRLGVFSRIAADEDAFMQAQADRLSRETRLPNGDLSARVLAGSPMALARRVARDWLETALGFVPGFDRIEAVLELARSTDQAAAVEVGGNVVVGCFGDAIRAGTRAQLRERARHDARLALPLAGSGCRTMLEGETVIVRGALTNETVAERRCSRAGRLTVQPVRRRGAPAAESAAWNEWLRRENVSPWIRDSVQGIGVDGVLWWIPRVGDYDGADGDRLVRVVWSDQEQS